MFKAKKISRSYGTFFCFHSFHKIGFIEEEVLFIYYLQVNQHYFYLKIPKKSSTLWTKLLMCSAMLKVLQTEDLACKKKHSFGTFFSLNIATV